MKAGKVFLVGAGRDISLITVKGLDAIKRADVILYDRLANPKLLEFAPSESELIYCGKLPDCHILRQEGINDLLVEKALEGKTVVRLKGGDPGVFGRVGEEAKSLVEFNIPFEMVPGISSGIAAPLYAGIPVTHREYAESFAVVTAHDKSKDGKPVLDWEGLARGVDTIAFYMGVGNLPFICEKLIEHGKPASTLVILIQWGTFGRQKTLQGTLQDIAETAAKAQFSNPSIILVGNVISLREKLKWFEKQPLYGRQILLARTGCGPSEMAKELMEHGADVIEFPKWKKTSMPADQQILAKLDSYEKILFASPESVDEFFCKLIEQEIDVRKVGAAFFGGSVKTKKALNERGFLAKLAERMPEAGKLLIVGDDSILKNNLQYNFQYGTFESFVTSKKQIDKDFLPLFKRMLEEAEVNTAVFPCAASVQAFMEGMEDCGLDGREFLKNLQTVCMGENTMRAAETAGIRSARMPEQPSRESLLNCVSKMQV
ncbi:uroporphyrinogen-III C-methyltransferase [Neobacillus sp. PS3-34]|uniref:uroporphyrinogen-III C-methyltransferase n=1 Tax=Neobacillus sp. PS3-34 TaxID=3070678 RepID=UPI0027DFB578|nr:uroporphyrinogen-III C-methyltransferase [Neobacillus sp. PS3-34]WML50131.1 uroporphyrinogen-III C-methyltransferase [Neobacillus sp. PS3-34]